MPSEINLTPTASFLELRSADNKSGQKAGTTLTARTWGTLPECNAGMLLLHGLGGHAGWFEALARRLKVNRMYVLAYDQLGFGKRRQDKFYSYNQWLEDLVSTYQCLQKLTDDKPLYILANSMGAAVALAAVAQKLIDPCGLVVFSAGLAGHRKTFNLAFRIKALITALLDPNKELELPYTIEQITQDETARQWIANDPDRRSQIPARMFLELQKMIGDMEERTSQICCPVLMYGSGEDKIVDMQFNEQFFKKLSSDEKALKIFPKAWHDLMFEPVIDEMVVDLITWLKKTTAAHAH